LSRSEVHVKMLKYPSFCWRRRYVSHFTVSISQEIHLSFDSHVKPRLLSRSSRHKHTHKFTDTFPDPTVPTFRKS